VDKKTAKIICTAVAIGKRHDFRFLKESGIERQLLLPVNDNYF